MREITMGSLFDGIGGFPYAASFYGIRALWASEIEPACVSVTKRHFPDMAHLGDITKLHGGNIPPVDIITFGSPCQGLSIAGQRLGLADGRSGLFLEAVRIIYEMKEATYGRYPRFALWENVPGALSSAGGRDYQTVLETLTKAKIPMPASGRWANAGMVRGGGVDLAWCVYNSEYFGTAQRRRRVFLITDFRECRAGEILFVPKSLQEYLNAGEAKGEGISACTGAGAGEAGGRPDVTSAHGKEGDAFCLAGNRISRKSLYGGNGLGCRKGTSYTLTTKDRHAVAVPAVTVRMRSGCEGGGKGPLVQFEKSGTLATRNDQFLFYGSDIIGHPYHVRYMTPLEWERLQGFPDGWTKQGDDGKICSDTKRFQMLGNSIAVPCAAYIMQGICHVLEDGKEEGKGQLHSGTDNRIAA